MTERFTRGLIVLCVLLAGTREASAESGTRVTLPDPMIRKQQVKAGLPVTTPAWTLGFDSTWPGQFGYRASRFKLTPAKPPAAKLPITIQVRVSTWDPSRPELTVDKTFAYPAKAVEQTFTLTTPQLFGSETIAWSVWIDGKLQKDISLLDAAAAIPHVQHIPGGLVALEPANGAAAPPVFTYNPRGAMNAIGGLSVASSDRPLPENWLHYTSLDLVVIGFDELADYAGSNPAAFASLRRWIASGGTLWLEDTGKEFRGLAEASKLLGIAAGAGVLGRSDSDGPLADAREWKWANLRAATSVPDVAGQPPLPEIARLGGPKISVKRLLPPTPPTTASTPPPKPPPAAKALTSEGAFAVAPLGFGVVAGFEGSWVDAATVFNAFEPADSAQLAGAYWQRRGWVARHGLVADAPNASFSNLLPEGVGLPPVNLFRLSVTAFVLIAGPLNFWLLRRYRRTQLSVLTIPLLGTLLTAMLFAFALLSEGFGVTTRSRSLTMLDQRRGELSAWNRTCYYAGAPPRGGLRFSDNAAVYPILPNWEDGVGAAGERQRRLQWSADVQQPGSQGLTRGWLATRQFEQFLVVESRPSDATLEVRQIDGEPKIKNRLGSPLELLVLLDEAGGFWVTESVDAEGEARLAKLDRNAALGRLRVLTADAQPYFPAGLADADELSWLNESRYRRRGYRTRERDYGALSLGDNLLNRTLARLTGIDGSPALDLPPRSYVAVTREAGWLDFGVENVAEEGSFHVLIGRY